MKSFCIRLVIAIMLLSLPVMSFLAPIAKAQLSDSWLNIEVTSFNGDNIFFNLQVTVLGNNLTDRIMILQQSEDGAQFWRIVQDRIYSQDTNTTVFSIDFNYSTNSPYYNARGLFPADSYTLVFYLESTFNMTVDVMPTTCQVPSQNYQGSFKVTQTSPTTLTVNVLINHSESFFWGVFFVLSTTLGSLYALTAYLFFLFFRRKPNNPSNIVTISSAIIFFVPVFEIAFYSLKSPLPLVFWDILMIILIPLNVIVIGLCTWHARP